MSEKNNEFLQRADAHISLANEQMKEGLTQGDISASFMYGNARFNAWIAACSFETAKEMKSDKDEAIDYFVNEYKLALEEHINHHIENYDFKLNKS